MIGTELFGKKSVSFTVGELWALQEVMYKVQSGVYQVGETALSRWFNRGNAAFIESETEVALQDAEQEGQDMSTAIEMGLGKGPRKLIVAAADVAILHYHRTEEAAPFLAEDLGLNGKINTLRGISSALTAREQA